MNFGNDTNLVWLLKCEIFDCKQISGRCAGIKMYNHAVSIARKNIGQAMDRLWMIVRKNNESEVHRVKIQNYFQQPAVMRLAWIKDSGPSNFLDTAEKSVYSSDVLSFFRYF